MENLTPEEKKISAEKARCLAEFLIFTCKNHVARNSVDEKSTDQAVNEVLAAMTGMYVEVMHFVYTDEQIQSLSDRYLKTLKYAMYMYDQTKEP